MSSPAEDNKTQTEAQAEPETVTVSVEVWSRMRELATVGEQAETQQAALDATRQEVDRLTNELLQHKQALAEALNALRSMQQAQPCAIQVTQAQAPAGIGSHYVAALRTRPTQASR